MRLFLRVGDKVLFHGIPVFELYSRDSLYVGDGTMINSSNIFYHLSMHSRCKFVANTKESKILIGANSRLHGVCINAREMVEIGSNVLIAANVSIVDSNGHEVSLPDPLKRIFTRGETSPVKICDGVWVGANSIILPGVTIGEGSVVAAGSVVSKSVPSNVLVAGVPAKIIREINH
jgi:acetyltransferase-like isoleucine patch superfamily enzyme